MNRPEVTVSRPLLDRHREQTALDHLLAGAVAGAGGSLVLRGEPGTGRTALLEYAVEHAGDVRVARLAGTEPEAGLGFAALHRLLMPFTDRLDRLPEPRRDALRAAFGQVPAAVPDRFMASLAVFALLSDVAATEPLLVAIDDAQWLDQATAEVLAFVARRLANEPIVFVIAVREPTQQCRPFDGLPDLTLAGLPDRDAYELLTDVVTGPLDGRIARRIVRETGGNPLALVEFGRQLTGGWRVAASPVTQPLPIGGRSKERFLRSVQTLPVGTQTLLLLAAAEPSGSPILLRRAAERLGLGADVARPALSAGLLTEADRVTFRHPLIRSAVYHGAAPHERRRVHGALASVVDAVADPDGHAWHLAAATAGPDEQVAGELVRSASRARANTDYLAEATLLTRAAELTPDPQQRADRLLDGAAANLSAGEPASAERLLDRADPGLATPPAQARATWLRATVSLAGGRFAEAAPALLRAACELRPVDPVQARRALLDAMCAALVAGMPASDDTLIGIVRAAHGRATEVPTAGDLLLDGFAARLTSGYGAAVPPLRQAVSLLVGGRDRTDFSPSVLAMGGWAAGDLLDGEAQRSLAGDRDPPHDVVTLAPTGLPGRADLLSLAWQGNEAETRSAAVHQIRSAGFDGTTAQYALAILDLGLGRYEAALTSALNVYRDDPPHLGTHVLPDLVEAASRAGNRGAARSALERLADRTAASGTALAAGLLARSQALLAGTDEAEGHYRNAIALLGTLNGTAHAARAHLLYGEWLRRQRRRRDAREQLRTASNMFDAAGFAAFAQRATGELLATGERAAKRTGMAPEELTPQEAQVARLVVEGSSNRQVAAQLFISPNTVEYHLQKVFRKVGVSSRTQLARALLNPAAAGVASA